VTVIAWSPYKYKERISLFGYEGVGKSSVILNILRYCPTAHAWVIDLDYSQSYERLIAQEYPDVADRVHIFQIDQDFTQLDQVFTSQLQSTDGYLLNQASPDDWLVVDPTTATWGMVQNYWLDQAYGDDLGAMFAQMRIAAAQAVEEGSQRKNSKNSTPYTVDQQFAADKADLMQWPIINKLYEEKFYKKLHSWRGHLLLCSEADGLRKDASDEEKIQYGHLGFKPKGQKTMPFVAATNLFLDHPSIDKWRFSTGKDRGRARVHNSPLDNFVYDYLIAIGGWQWSDDQYTAPYIDGDPALGVQG